MTSASAATPARATRCALAPLSMAVGPASLIALGGITLAAVALRPIIVDRVRT